MTNSSYWPESTRSWVGRKSQKWQSTYRIISLKHIIGGNGSLENSLNRDLKTEFSISLTFKLFAVKNATVMIVSFRTDRSGQTVQTQIRLLLEEQSDQGLHCLQFPLHLLVTSLYGRAIVQILGWLQRCFGCPNIQEIYGISCENEHCFIWATTRQNVSSGVSDPAGHKPACAATEAS